MNKTTFNKYLKEFKEKINNDLIIEKITHIHVNDRYYNGVRHIDLTFITIHKDTTDRNATVSTFSYIDNDLYSIEGKAYMRFFNTVALHIEDFFNKTNPRGFIE